MLLDLQRLVKHSVLKRQSLEEAHWMLRNKIHTLKHLPRHSVICLGSRGILT